MVLLYHCHCCCDEKVIWPVKIPAAQLPKVDFGTPGHAWSGFGKLGQLSKTGEW